MTHAYPAISLSIGGKEVAAERFGEVLNPADGAVVGHYPMVTPEQLDHAVEVAHRAFLSWRRSAPKTRADILLRAAAWLKDHREDIAHSITLEQGKPLRDARSEVDRACDILEWDAGEARRLYGRVIPAPEGMNYVTVRKPYGVVAGFSPWNFPISNLVRKVSGAVASGCTIIMTPSSETPSGGHWLLRAFVEAGVPDGVVNLVTGRMRDITARLIPNPLVRMVAYTGSTDVGKALSALAGQHMKPVVMELGGHAPVIVCADADIPAAVKAGVLAKSRNAGQVCTCATRFYIQQEVYAPFVEAFAAESAAIRLGPGLDPATQMGPLTNPRRVAAVDAMVRDAVDRGARLMAGGQRPNGPGNFYPLSVIADVPDDALALHEEPFGPLAILSPFTRLEDAIDRANALPYGLAGYAFTQSARNIQTLLDDLEVGNIGVNQLTGSVAETPFGGLKDSGMGREGGIEGLMQFTYAKTMLHRI